MSPEQVKSLSLDGRSDIYSLGIILYELLAGQRPFDSEDTLATLYQHVHEEPPPLKKIRPDLSSKTLAIITTCLEKDPIHRYQQADAMIPAIDAALQAEANAIPNPQITQVLAHLSDSSLISRQRIIHTDDNTPKGKMPPAWVMVIGFLLLLTVLYSLIVSGGDNVSVQATMIPEIVATETAVPTTKPTSTFAPVTPRITLEPTLSVVIATTIPPPTEPPTPTPTPTKVPVTIIDFTVNGTTPRNETGLRVETGQQITVEYVSGGWRAGPPPTWPIVGPNGDPQVASKITFPVANAPVVSLIAGVGNTSPFFIGQQSQFNSPASGILWLGANDDDFSDNEGANSCSYYNNSTVIQANCHS